MNQKELVKNFENGLASQGIAPNTRRGYLRYLNAFLTLLKTMNVDIKDVKAEQITMFLANYNKRNKTTSSSAIARAALRRFFFDNDIIINWGKVRVPKRKKRETVLLTAEEFEKIVKELPEPERSAFILGTGSGLRCSELSNLHFSDIDWENNKVFVRYHGKQEGLKTGEGSVLMLENVQAMLRKYNSPILKGGKGPVFLVKHKNGKTVVLNEYRFWKKIQEARDRAKIFKKVHPHTCRHLFGTIVYRKYHDIIKTQQRLRHLSIATSQLYVNLNNDNENVVLPFEKA